MQKKQNILITIAARGGSTGLKNKNIKKLMGRPLIAYTVRQAVKWGKASNIICSTDSEKIAREAKKYGAEVLFMRPKRLSGRGAGKVAALRHALLKCEKIYRKKYDIIMDLDVTQPFRKIRDLDNCLRMFRRKKPLTLLSSVRSRKNPYFNMVEKKPSGKAVLCKTLKRPILARQEAPQVYELNASIYIFDRSFLIDERNTSAMSDNTEIYVMNETAMFDIDTEMDFRFAEFLIKKGIVRNLWM